MKKRFLWILFISLSISVLLAGCGGSELKTKVQTPEEAAKMQGDPLQNLAAKEEKWLDKLDKVHSAVAESYKQWEQGKLTRQLLNEQLDKEYNKVRALKKSYDMHIKANPLPPEAKDEKVYYQGLQYGKKITFLGQ